MGRRSLHLPVCAVFLGHGRGWNTLAVLPRWHALVYPVEATRLLKVSDLPCWREALDG